MKPLPAVNEVELALVSVFPITIEVGTGVKEVTEGVVEPAEELPVEEAMLGLELISYMETEPVAVEEKEAVIVSAPELPAVAYQM